MDPKVNIKNKKVIRLVLLGVCTYIYFQIMYIVGYHIHKNNDKSIEKTDEIIPDKIQLHGKWKLIKLVDSFDVKHLVSGSKNAIEIANIDSLPAWYKGELIGLIYQYVDADSGLLQRPFYLSVQQIGASEIYINNQKIIDIGQPSDNINNEECINYSKPFLVYMKDTFTIFIKHSELTPMYWKKRINYDYQPGIHLSFSKKKTDHTELFLSFIIGFLVTLFLIHLLLFFFYPEVRENLFFAVFLLCFTSVWICFLFSGSSVFTVNLIGLTLLDTAISATFISLILFIQKLFQQHLNKIIWSMILLVFLLSCSNIFIKNNILETLKITGTVWLIVFSVIYMFVTISKYSKKQIPGIKIILSGIFIFGFFVFIIISILFYVIFNKVISPDLSIQISIEGNTFITLILSFILILALFSIPISMSIYLAYKFAHTNIQLKNKLTEVENLNKEIIQKEKEKQEILIKQNEVLEQQVKERTYEIFLQKNLIEQKNKDILDSINYASRIQKALITPDDFIQKHFINNQIFSEYFVLYLPKDIVSGDFYWSTTNPTHHKKPHYLAVCDCTGHGVPGAFMSLLNINYLNEAVQEKQLYYPDEILNYVRNKLIQNLSYDEQQKDGMDASLILFDQDFYTNKKIYFTLANHQIIHIKPNTPPQIISGDKMPVGKGHFESNFKLISMPLNSNDWLYLYTDGYKDQFGGEKEKRITQKKFIEILSTIYTKSASDQKKYLHQFFMDWKKNNEQTDDICIIGFKIT